MPRQLIPPIRRTRRDLESPVQAAILDAIATLYPSVFVHSIPNGGFILSARAVAKLKWQGLKPGVPDLALYWSGGHGMIEVKAEGGRLSDDQIAVHAILRDRGVKVAVCRSIDDLIQTMREWGVPGRIAA